MIRRLLVFLLAVGFITANSRGVDVIAEGNNYQWYTYTLGTITYHNYSASPVSVTFPPLAGNANSVGFPDATTGPGFIGVGAQHTNSTQVIAAGGTLTRTVSMNIGSNTGYSSGATYGEGYVPDQTVDVSFPYVIGGVTHSYTRSITVRTRFRALGTVSVGLPLTWDGVTVGAPPPAGKITVIAEAANVGAAVVKVGTDEMPVTLAAGSNVVHETTTPDDMPDGAPVEVLQFGAVVGSGTIAKDPFGNFDLTITLSAPAGQGKIHITHTPELTGEVSIWIGTEQVDAYTISSPGMTWDFTVEPFTQYPDGAQVTLKKTVNGDHMVLGSGTIVYGSGPAGGWVVNIGASGKSDVTAEENEVVARLDLTAYNAENLQISVRIDGGELIPVDMLATADAMHGTRKEVIFRQDNSLGNLSGKTIEWVVSGTIDGVPVNQQSIASATIPAGRVISTDPIVMDNSAMVESSAMVGSQSNNPPPENPFDPEDPDNTPENLTQYKVMRQAVQDAMNSGSNTPTPGLPSMRAAEQAGTAAGKAVSAAMKSAAGIGSSAPGPGVGTWTGTNALTVTLPVLGSMTWDPADYGVMPNILRTIALVGLLWQYFRVCTAILRSANV